MDLLLTQAGGELLTEAGEKMQLEGKPRVPEPLSDEAASTIKDEKAEDITA